MSYARAGRSITLFVGFVVTTIAACRGARDAGAERPATVDDGGVLADAHFADVMPALDAEPFVFHDAGVDLSCVTTCDCPQGLACREGMCRALSGPVYCCTRDDCPPTAACLDEQERPGSCPRDEPPDAGGRDTGIVGVGSYCEDDTQCGPGRTCWERAEPPFIWNYCTVENCLPECPMGSACLQFNLQPPDGPVIGCLQRCANEAECRMDAYCLNVPGAGFSVCLPDCRDDLLDCTPRDGNHYCSVASGQCELTPQQSPIAEVGDACSSNLDCGLGDVCMGELAWDLPDGMCTHVCGGASEATPCALGETCRTFSGLELCFRDCTNGICPERPSAECLTLDPSWTAPGCIAR